MTHIVVSAGATALLACAVAMSAGSPEDGARQRSATTARVKTGVWGGEHVRLEVTDAGAAIEYDCGRGTIDERLMTDAGGRFLARGHHVRERGGPVRADEPPPPSARYTGRVTGKTMTLTVAIEGEKTPIGPFTLTYGVDTALMKCK
jgi:hypothetical protein